MNYSFFGTCANDHKQLFGCLETILNQSINPREIIIVDSGDINIECEIKKIFKNKNIKLIYIKKKLPRVKALNFALDKSSSIYSFRFDTRSRFSFDYAKFALEILSSKYINATIVGGSPTAISEKETFQSKICAQIMSRDYVFFYPKHRRENFSGFSSSVYLGCFRTAVFKKLDRTESKSDI